MKMGTLATIGAYAPGNLIHIILDNGTYDSTGGQPTVSGSVDFACVAADCGYPRSARSDGLDGFEKALAAAVGAVIERGGPYLIHMRIQPGSMDNLGRPTVKPDAVARRFKEFIGP